MNLFSTTDHWWFHHPTILQTQTLHTSSDLNMRDSPPTDKATVDPTQKNKKSEYQREKNGNP